MEFEFLIPDRPVSLQTRNRENLRQWKAYVASEAAKSWEGSAVSDGNLGRVPWSGVKPEACDLIAAL
jgi:hypothetical protein